MKKIILIVCLLTIMYSCQREKLFCGKVVEKYREGWEHKSSSGTYPHVVFYCDEVKRNIDVRVTNNCYVNTKVGENVCFNLSEYQLEQ